MKVPYLDVPAQIRALRPALDAAIARTLDAGSFCLGPDVEKFERDFALAIGTAHAIAFNSGTSALHVAARLLNLGPGDEVITTPYTFIATSWAIAYVGATPVYVDVEDATLNINPTRIEQAITSRTKAILPVHLYGHPFDADPILELCRSRNLSLIEDAAQAHGARYRGRSVGTLAELAAFSFYPTKNLGACGEGGALVTDRADYAARARSLREHGSSTRYHHDEIGYNYRMEGIQGAVLGVKLPHLAAWTDARRRIAARYRTLLKSTPLRLPQEEPWAESAYHLFVVRHPARDRLREHLQSRGIGTAVHYPLPLHLQKCFAHLGYREGDFPVAEKAARECLCLPLYPELTDSQIDYVAGSVQEFTGW
jgi:dTDP-4-amino-4,6-dideoxygalactose transaminase